MARVVAMLDIEVNGHEILIKGGINQNRLLAKLALLGHQTQVSTQRTGRDACIIVFPERYNQPLMRAALADTLRAATQLGCTVNPTLCADDVTSPDSE